MERFDYQQSYDEDREKSEDWYQEFLRETNRIFKSSRRAWDRWNEKMEEQEKKWQS